MLGKNLGPDVERHILGFLMCSEILPDYFISNVWPRLIRAWPAKQLTPQHVATMGDMWNTHCFRIERDARKQIRGKQPDYVSVKQCWSFMETWIEDRGERMADTVEQVLVRASAAKEEEEEEEKEEKEEEEEYGRGWRLFWYEAFECFFRIVIHLKGGMRLFFSPLLLPPPLTCDELRLQVDAFLTTQPHARAPDGLKNLLDQINKSKRACQSILTRNELVELREILKRYSNPTTMAQAQSDISIAVSHAESIVILPLPPGGEFVQLTAWYGWNKALQTLYQARNNAPILDASLHQRFDAVGQRLADLQS